jgi:predicted transcriptional regulator
MGKKSRAEPALGHRERQIMDAVFRLGEGSVGEVLKVLPNPPTYSTVRKMMSLLEEKGLLRHRREGTKYIYQPLRSREAASRSAVKHLLTTFFSGSAADAVNAILDVSSDKLGKEDFDRLRKTIEQARDEGK